jgi:hypothetical protein
MTDHKKKGDFNKNGKDDVGGNKKQQNDSGQNSGHGGRSSGGRDEPAGVRHVRFRRRRAAPALRGGCRNARSPRGGRASR